MTPKSRKYVVSTVSERDGRVATAKVGRYRSMNGAMKAAKTAANTSADCVTYGPSSIAYVGEHATAVIAW